MPDDTKVIQLGCLLAPRDQLVLAPGAIAEALERAHLPVREANGRRCVPDILLPRVHRSAAALGPSALSSDPIPVPFDGASVGALIERASRVSKRHVDRGIRCTRTCQRGFARLGRTHKRRPCGIVKPPPQIQHAAPTEMESLHRPARAR